MGLVWTAMGGEIMFVEASKMAGSGELTLTGQLGDVTDEGISTDCSQPGQSQCFHSESSDQYVHVYVTIRFTSNFGIHKIQDHGIELTL